MYLEEYAEATITCLNRMMSNVTTTYYTGHADQTLISSKHYFTINANADEYDVD